MSSAGVALGRETPVAPLCPRPCGFFNLNRRVGDFSLMWIRRTRTPRSMRPKRHRLSVCDRVLQQRRKQRHDCDEPIEGSILQQTSATCQALCLCAFRRRLQNLSLVERTSRFLAAGAAPQYCSKGLFRSHVLAQQVRNTLVAL